MSQTETDTAEIEIISPIETIFEGQCESLTKRSILNFSIGRHAGDGTLHLAITGNSGRGMWCKDWVSASAIQDVVLGEVGLNAMSLRRLQAGRSINGCGFILSAIKYLGLVRTNAENTRLHEHVPTTTFEQVVMARITGSTDQVPKPNRRKGKVD